MRRRAYIGALAGGTGLLAGCMGDGGGGGTPTRTPAETPTATPTPTPEPTETPTPTPTEPQLERANMVWGVEGEDWFTEKAIESAGVGATVIFGFDYVFPAERSQPAGTMEIRVMDDGGSTVVSDDFSFELDATDTDLIDRIGRISANMDGQPAGSYTAELTLRNKYTRERSDPMTVAFDLVEPLQPDEVALLDYRPRRIAVDESFQFELDFENRSSRDSSIVAQLGYRKPGWNSSADLSRVSYEIPAESRITRRLGTTSYDEPMTLTYVLPTVDIEWTIEVT